MIRYKTPGQDKWEMLLAPAKFFLAETVEEGDNLLDLGTLAEGEFRGMAVTFGSPIDAYIPTFIQRGAFTKTIQERERSIPILWQHNIDEPIGRPTKLFESDSGLVLQAQISRTNRGRDALILMRDGVINALSVGFDPVIFDFVEQPDGSMQRFIREARLHEISVVTLGADAQASISEVQGSAIPGSLTKFWSGINFANDEHEIETEGMDSLATRFAAFIEDSEAQSLPEHELLELFQATLHEAEPVTPLTLSDVDDQLMAAQIMEAEMELLSL